MFVLALSGCALMMATGAGAKQKPVTRPFKMMVHSQQVINLRDGSFVGRGEGVASHLGLITIEGPGNLAEPISRGTITVASGDLIYWEWEISTLLVTITGGTGRFEGAGGEFVMDVELVSQKFDPAANTITNTYIWAASGTISY
jgi:hypothetical protein